MTKIKIDFVTALSTCPVCKKADEKVKKLLEDYGSRIELNHVDMVNGKGRDIEKIRKKYGVILTPFLAVNGKVIANGKTPDEKKIKDAIERS